MVEQEAALSALGRPRIEYRTPVDLVEAVRSGQVRIPPFQRPFRWDTADVVALFDSLFRGYPVGNLLLWRRPAPAGRVRIGPLDIDADAVTEADWVIDGQQRITSLVGALTASEETSDPRFRVYFDLESAQFHSLGTRQQPSSRHLPVHRLADTRDLLAWHRENADHLTDAQVDLADSIAKAIREYQIPTYLVTGGEEEPLRVIFDRLNNTGKPLRKEEVFGALHAGLDQTEPSTLHQIATVTAELGFGAMDERLALRCVLAYRGGDVFRDFRDEFRSDDDRVETFRGVAEALPRVVGFLREDAGIPHFRLMPYSHVVPVLVRWVRRYGEPAGRLATLLRRWVWRGAAAGIRAGATSVATVRNAVDSIEGDDPYASAARLLSQADSMPRSHVDIATVHMRHANARITLLSLLAVGPRDLVTGEPLDVESLVDKPRMTQEIVHASSPLSGTFANRIVRGTPVPHVYSALLTAPLQVAGSHLVDEECIRLAIREDEAGFLERRAELVRAQVRQHLDAMAEWGARDGRSVVDLLRAVG